MLEAGLEEQRAEGRGLSTVAKDKRKSWFGGGAGGGGWRTRVRFHRREWKEVILTACGSYDNCDFSYLLTSCRMFLSVNSGRRKRIRRKEGSVESRGAVRRSGGAGQLIARSERGAVTEAMRGREGTGFHQLQDYSELSPQCFYTVIVGGFFVAFFFFLLFTSTREGIGPANKRLEGGEREDWDCCQQEKIPMKEKEKNLTFLFLSNPWVVFFFNVVVLFLFLIKYIW